MSEESAGTSDGTGAKPCGAGYVPAERVLVPAVAMPGLLAISDDFIGMVLRVGDKFKSIGDKDGAIAAYEHFIGQLRRFTMVPLDETIKDY